MKTKVSSVIILAFIFLNVSAQESTKVIEDVILYQSEAHLVRMTQKGKILAFIKEVPNSYTALNNVTPQAIVMSAVEVAQLPDMSISEKSRVNFDLDSKPQMAEDDGSKMDKSKEEEMETDEQATGELTAEEEMDEMIAEATVQSEEEMLPKGEDTRPTNYDYEFAFDHRDATLSPSVVNQLNQVAIILKENEELRAEIKSFYSETVDISKVLSKNRAKGIQDQLVAYGIDRSKITISESNNEDWANNRVQLLIY
ncbi:OmpA family protein [Portibacter marinus]|uniref:OmpA family protein n=1 Tax=Portibacter marinus TaxID=2898660 RepID=UPI001F3F8D5C|nr:hypothetical protein [Portibacter marinus]